MIMLSSRFRKLGSSGVHFLFARAHKTTTGSLGIQKSLKANLQNPSNRNCILKGQQQHRSFKTTSTHNAVHPIFALLMSRAAKYGGAIFGRVARSWWKKLPQEEKALYTGKVRRIRYIFAGVLGAMGLGAFVYYEQHLEETPFTNRKRLMVFNESQIVEIGNIVRDKLLKNYENRIIPESSAKYKRVYNAAQHLLSANGDLCTTDFEWTMYVIDDDFDTNPGSLPGGSIFVPSGVLEFCENDDQLAIILAHEIAHVILGHGAENLSSMHFVNLMLIIPLAAVWAFLPSDIIAVIVSWMSDFSRKILAELPQCRLQEHEADKVGLLLAAKACVDVREAPILWEKNVSSGGHGKMKWLSTHPSDASRLAKMEEMLPEAIEVRNKCKCPRFSALSRKVDDEKEIDYSFAI